jgi:hypothetical protein
MLRMVKRKTAMEYVCTTCCKDKKTDEELLPASQRYISERIDFVSQESIKLRKPFLIFSGFYGFIDADFMIPWYDKALENEDVLNMIAIAKEQLLEKKVSKIIFYGKPRSIPGWESYYEVLEKSCNQLGIPITFRETDLD